tara:strand:+ start:189 stop:1172 length:984 start_codon:yes stop_codon:yes gene_type:complete
MLSLMNHDLTTLEEIRMARGALPDVVRRTPILPLAPEVRNTGREVLHLKAENLQVTGAYKVRSAFNVLNSLSDAERRQGVVMASSGNFAQAFAFAGATLGVSIVVVMLDQTSPYKIAATRDLGAEVVFCGKDALNRQPKVEEVSHDRSMTGIDTWEYRPVIAGHASIGLEIVEDLPGVEQVLVPVSSGGLAAGIASAVKLTAPNVRVVGVQPENANAYYLSRQAGKPVTLSKWDSIADGLSARYPGTFPFHHLQAYMDDVVLISEKEIAEAARGMLFRGKLLVEPAGAVAAAGYLSAKVDQSLVTVAVATGGNLTKETLNRLLEMSG